MKVLIKWDLVFEALKYKLENKLAENAPVHDAQLRNSIVGKVDGDVLKYYMVDYAIYVNEGTAPHWTSVDNLKKWCKDKWGDENLAYALQRHIALHGTEPSKFIQETIEQYVPDLLAEALKTKGAVEVQM